MSTAAKLPEQLLDSPFLVLTDYVCKSEEAKDKIVAALKSSSQYSTRNVSDVLSYAFYSVAEEPLKMRFLELYKGREAWFRHVEDENVQASLAILFDKETIKEKSSSSVVCFGVLDEGVDASVKAALDAPVLENVAGFTIFPNRELVARPCPTSFAFNFYFTLKSDVSDAETELKKMLSKISGEIMREKVHGIGFVTFAVVKSKRPPFAKAAATATTFELHVILMHTGQMLREFLVTRKEHRLVLERVCERIELTVVGDGSDDVNETIDDFLDDFKSLATTIVARRATLDAGFVTHEALKKMDSRELKKKKEATTAVTTTTGPPQPPPPPAPAPHCHVASTTSSSSPDSLFHLLRNDFTNVAEFIQFNPSAEGRSAHLTKKKAPSAYSDDGATLRIPLLHVLKKLTSMASMDIKVPISRAFCQLARLRSLRDDVALVNSLASAASSSLPRHITGSTLLRLNRFLKNLQEMGYPLNKKGAKVSIEGLEELVTTLETEYKELVADARVDLRNDKRIKYMALQELYTIGSIVKTNVSSLAGTEVGFRVVDVHYEPMKSMFGSERFSFRLAVEALVMVGDAGHDLLLMPFEEVVADYEGVRSILDLQYVPIDEAEESSLLTLLRARGAALRRLTGGAPGFFSYSGGSFFPRRKAGVTNAFSTSASTQLTSSGRIMVDVKYGIELGVSPGAGADAAGTALSTLLKQYRQVMRVSEGDDLDKRLERLNQAGFTTMSSIPNGDVLELICWPAVPGFSFSGKTWGSVLVDTLRTVDFNARAFDELVLADDVKELLLALVKDSMGVVDDKVGGGGGGGGGDHNGDNDDDDDGVEERFRGVLGDRNSGSLFLLHGSPGTGKTLTVQALAELLRVPLYNVSFGELGANVAELEATMNDVIMLCSRWSALILLDEGDALLERRQSSQLLLNSMTGVLLRVLDSFSGCLFITSNRVAAFDEAVLSRVTLAVEYIKLGHTSRSIVWRNVLSRMGCDLSLFDFEELAHYALSGREVNAAARLALSLSKHRGRPRLERDTLINALNVATAFRRSFKTVEQLEADEREAAAEAAEAAEAAKKRASESHHHHLFGFHKDKKEKGGAPPSLPPSAVVTGDDFEDFAKQKKKKKDKSKKK